MKGNVKRSSCFEYATSALANSPEQRIKLGGLAGISVDVRIQSEVE
tara:strand:+ start:325 stop:462 length:138 start_codon:yes stop_codon:yes gene_type:complete